MKDFTAQQKEIVARKLGYDGPMQGFDEFIASSPALEAKYSAITGKYAERMAKGGLVKNYQAGGAVGVVRPSSGDRIMDSTGAPIDNQTMIPSPILPVDTTTDEFGKPLAGKASQVTAAQITATPDQSISTAARAGEQAAQVTGGATATAGQATAAQAGEAAAYEASKAAPAVGAALAGVTGATGAVSKEAQVTAAQGQVSKEAIAKAPTAPAAAQVAATPDLALTEGQVAKAATMADVGGPAKATAATTDKTFAAQAAQLTGTPQAKAETAYTLPEVRYASMDAPAVLPAAKAAEIPSATS